MGDGNDQLRILVVDDEPLVLQAYERILRKFDPLDSGSCAGRPFDVCCCLTASQGLQQAEEACAAGRPFALAFLDLKLPSIDGVTLAEALRSLDDRMHFVIVTGRSDVSLGDISRRVGPADKLLYLQKPFHPAEILQFTAALSAKWDAERRLHRNAQQLEALVEERTRQLEEANRQLRHDVERQREQEQMLSQQLAELERFNRLTVGRELRMVELKREVNAMAVAAGQTPPYDLSEQDDSDGEERLAGVAPWAMPPADEVASRPGR